MNKEKSSIPLFKSWKAWYFFVLLVLLLQVALFYLLTKHFS